MAKESKTKKSEAVSRTRRKHCYEYPRPSVTVDIALFYRGGGRRAEVLLIKRASEPFKGRWAFPGGFVDENESLEAAARRELREETGLKKIKLKQVGAFGDPGRDPRGHTVSIVFASVLKTRDEAQAADDADEAAWHSVARPPRLAFDHKKILRLAFREMLGKSSSSPGRRKK